MNKKKFVLSLVITLVICLILSATFGLFSFDMSLKGVLDNSEGEITNILVVGVDKDEVRSDVNIIFSLNEKEKTVNLLSIPRDTRISYTSRLYGKINACIGKDNGDELLIEKVKELTGMPIHDFCKVNFEGLRNIIDILGGVEYDVPIDMNYDDPVQDLHIHIKKGKQILNGADAEGLLRYRKGYATGDLGRIDVQQDFLKELMRQKLNIKYIFKAVPIISEISDNVDTDMTIAYMLKKAWAFRNGQKLEFNSYVLPGAPKMIGGASYYVCDEKATEDLIRTEFGYSDEKITSTNRNNISEKVID